MVVNVIRAPPMAFGDCVWTVKDNPLTLACRFCVLYLARCREMTRAEAAALVMLSLFTSCWVYSVGQHRAGGYDWCVYVWSWGGGGKLEAEVDSITQSTQASVSVPRWEADALIAGAEARWVEPIAPTCIQLHGWRDNTQLSEGRVDVSGCIKKKKKVYHSVQSFCLDLSTCLRRSKVCHIQQVSSLKLDSSTLPRFSLKHFTLA